MIKDLLKIKWELLTTPLFITLFILDLVFVGTGGIKECIFATLIFLEIPLCYVGTKIVRSMIYKVWIGSNKYEN